MKKEDSLLALQKAYDDLRHHVVELEREFRESGLITEVEAFETTVLEEETTKELGRAGAMALGLTVLHSAVKAVLPAKAAIPVVGGAWILGGAFIIFRLTAGTVAGWVHSSERNAKRKLYLRRKLQILEERLQTIIKEQEIYSASHERPLPSGQHSSPPESTSSSVELVEAPAETSGTKSNLPEPGTAGKQSKEEPKGFESWKQYATLGRRK